MLFHLSGSKKRVRIMLQGIIGGGLLFCIFYAVSNVPLGNASAIFFCTPVFTFFFAILLFGVVTNIWM